MESHWLIERLRDWGSRPALIWRQQVWSYDELCACIDIWRRELTQRAIAPGRSLAICGDYSPNVCALILAAIANRNIVVPLTPAIAPQWELMMEVAQVEHAVRFDRDECRHFAQFGRRSTHPLLQQLIARRTPGMVLFSSGSTGASKASLLDFDRVLEKFRLARPAYRTLAFLLLDHIGGLNTLMHGLCHGGTIVTTRERTPDAVCAAVEKHRIQLLPTTPTFLRMLLIADATKRYDLTSLEVVTYGTEPMPASTLAALRAALPSARLKQTYGLSELGILPTQSRSSDSLWLKLGTKGFEHKIVDDALWIRAQAAMLGYLNAPSPFDSDGWFNTQDLVEMDGEYLRILGRKSELINVGGQKVHPTEVEDVLLQLENVKDATVCGRPNPITGEVVAAKITTLRPEQPDALKRRIRRFCQERLERYKVPAMVEVVEEAPHSVRFKKARKAVKC